MKVLIFVYAVCQMWMILSWQVGALLEHTVGHIDPLHLVNKVPGGMHIPRLVSGLLITKD